MKKGQSKNMTGVIILNKMYSGSYLTQANNIGHEVINLIKDDNEDNYIYINPWGTMEKEYYKENNKIDTVLLVRDCGIPDTLEILAKAWDLHVDENEKVKKSHNKDIKRIKEAQEQHNITYGNGKSLKDIYKDNTIDKNAAYYTFKAGQLRRPNNPLYISFAKPKDSDKSNFFYLNKAEYWENVDNIYKKDAENKVMIVKKSAKVYRLKTDILSLAKRSPKMYIKNCVQEYPISGQIAKENVNDFAFYNEKGERIYDKNTLSDIEKYKKTKDGKIKITGKYVNQQHAYSVLYDIIHNKPELWQEQNETEKVVINSENYNHCFLDVINKNYDELVYSNLFHYVFSNMKYFCKFANEVLFKLENKNESIDYSKNLEDNFKIIREKEKNIDIFITIGKHIFVIENKIKSEINGVVKDEEGNTIRTQLKKYAEHIFSKYPKAIKHFYLFAPKYSHFEEEDLKVNVKEETVYYTVINYKKILDFFSENIINDYKKEGFTYIEEFISAIKRHTYDVDNILERQMFERFAKRINELTSENNQGDN